MTVIVKPGVGHLDGLYSKFVYETLPFWHAIKVTPNILTTFGLISSIACVYFIYKRNTPLAILFLLLRMYFDYADGLTARRYNQTTKIGDWYDHIVDVCFFSIPLLIVLFMT
jgi:phosphatidylglycerophosphate synthase